MRSRGKFFTVIVSVLMVFLSLFIFSSCQSTDKKQVYMDVSGFENAEIEYNPSTRETKIVLSTRLKNNTIYRVRGVFLTLNLFYNSENVGEEIVYYAIELNNGGEYTGGLICHVKGEVDAVSIVSWEPDVCSFWDTYNIWIIVTAVITIVAAIALIIAIAAEVEIFDLIPALIIFGLVAVIILGSVIWAAVTKYWVNILIIGAGVIIIVLVGLVAYLIKELL